MLQLKQLVALAILCTPTLSIGPSARDTIRNDNEDSRGYVTEIFKRTASHSLVNALNSRGETRGRLKGIVTKLMNSSSKKASKHGDETRTDSGFATSTVKGTPYLSSSSAKGGRIFAEPPSVPSKNPERSAARVPQPSIIELTPVLVSQRQNYRINHGLKSTPEKSQTALLTSESPELRGSNNIQAPKAPRRCIKLRKSTSTPTLTNKRPLSAIPELPPKLMQERVPLNRLDLPPRPAKSSLRPPSKPLTLDSTRQAFITPVESSPPPNYPPPPVPEQPRYLGTRGLLEALWDELDARRFAYNAEDEDDDAHIVTELHASRDFVPYSPDTSDLLDEMI